MQKIVSFLNAALLITLISLLAIPLNYAHPEDELASQLEEAYDRGYESGYAEGYRIGFAAGSGGGGGGAGLFPPGVLGGASSGLRNAAETLEPTEVEENSNN
ncbi:MAG: hypothetical protein GKR91_05960 [Pseudomonadales bacterium]|nr:hypothetical protein [Pseudomonadales bacterium]